MMPSSILTCINLVLALAGPAIVDVASALRSSGQPNLALHAFAVLAIVLLVVWVYAVAIRVERYTLDRLGFGRFSWYTPFLAVTLAMFFIFAFGPLAYWVFAKTGVGTFDTGLSVVRELPAPYLARPAPVPRAPFADRALQCRSRHC